MLNDGNPHYSPLLDDFRFMLKELGETVVKHYYREQNGVADIVAKKVAAMEASRGLHLFVAPPVHVLDQVWADINRTNYSRYFRINNSNLGHSLNCFIVEPD